MIINGIAKIKDCASGINKNISFATVSSYVMQVEQEICKRILGKDLYAIIDANNGLTAQQELLKSYLEVMISNFTVYFAYPIINVSTSELGVQQTHSQNSTPAELWRYNEAKNAYFRTGDIYREIAYKFLQDNQNDFPEWQSSTSYSIYNQFLIRSNEDLHEVLGKGESVGTFLALRPYLELAQTSIILPVLCRSFLEKIIGYTRIGTALNDYEIEVRRLAKAAMAWSAFAMSLPSIRCLFIDGTLVTALPTESSKVYSPISDNEKTAIQIDAEQKAQQYIGLLKEYLQTNATFIEDYTKTDCYKALVANKGDLNTHKGANSFGIRC